jgi:hypothetical protein
MANIKKPISKRVSFFWMLFFLIAGILISRLGDAWYITVLVLLCGLMWFGALIELFKKRNNLDESIHIEK